MNAKAPDPAARSQADAPAPDRDLPPGGASRARGGRCAASQPKPARPRELNGRGGPDPVRYGDWEVKGLASDF